MKIFYLFFFSFFLIPFSFSQAPEIEWENRIGGNSYDEMRCVAQTADGGYILGGESLSGISTDKSDPNFGYSDFWVVKLDIYGEIIWDKTFGGSSEDRLRSIQQTSDGGYILGGNSESGISGNKTEINLGQQDYWIIKIDSLGILEWQNTVGGNNNEYLYSIEQTIDGGFILGGYSESGISGDKTEASIGGQDYWVVKVNNLGEIEWDETIGGTENDNLFSVQQTSDGGYILGGYTSSGISGDKTEASLGVGYTDYWVIKINSVGGILWQNTIGGNFNDYLQSIDQTADGGYIIGGYSLSELSGDKTEINLGNYDYWVLKLNALGSIQWQNTIGGVNFDQLTSVEQTSDGLYIIGGYSNSGYSPDITDYGFASINYLIFKLNSIGDILWDNQLGGNGEDYNTALKQTSDGGYIVGGYTNYGPSGDITETNYGGTDFWVVKLLPEDCEPLTFYADVDEDGFGNNLMPILTCGIPIGYVTDNSDCNDANVLIFPGAIESCNDLDDNCNLIIDEGFPEYTYYLDADADGYGNILSFIVICSATPPTNYVINNSDCNDANYFIHETQLYFADVDGDLYGDSLNSDLICSLLPPAGFVTNSLDCNDLNIFINPVSNEICNEVDDDCNGIIDDGLILFTYYLDNDGDLFGNELIFLSDCFGSPPVGYVFDNTDCNDDNLLINPVSNEICNLVDDNCNTEIDEGLSIQTLYIDADGDDFGNPLIDTITCLLAITGYLSDSTDCDDTNPDVFPGAEEIFNSLDDNCNKLIDEGVGIEDFENANFIIYPNPSIENIIISLSNNILSNHHSPLTITDLSGKIISELNISSSETEIDISNYTSGIYFVKILIDNKQLTGKFIKQ